MQLRTLIARRGGEPWLTGARAVLAFTLAIAIGFTPHLHLAGLIGTLGMYAVTDGVFTALSRRKVAGPFAGAEAAISIGLGLWIMLWGASERGLLLLFCARSAVIGGAELIGAARTDGVDSFLRPRAARAFLTYAGLSTLALSLAFALTALFGYGALDLHACLAGQLAIWAGLVFAHVLRSRRSLHDEGASTHTRGSHARWRRERPSWSGGG